MKDALLSTVIDEYSTVEAFASVLALEEKALTAVEPLVSREARVTQRA